MRHVDVKWNNEDSDYFWAEMNSVDQLVKNGENEQPVHVHSPDFLRET